MVSGEGDLGVILRQEGKGFNTASKNICTAFCEKSFPAATVRGLMPIKPNRCVIVGCCGVVFVARKKVIESLGYALRICWQASSGRHGRTGQGGCGQTKRILIGPQCVAREQFGNVVRHSPIRLRANRRFEASSKPSLKPVCAVKLKELVSNSIQVQP